MKEGGKLVMVGVSILGRSQFKDPGAGACLAWPRKCKGNKWNKGLEGETPGT